MFCFQILVDSRGPFETLSFIPGHFVNNLIISRCVHSDG